MLHFGKPIQEGDQQTSSMNTSEIFSSEWLPTTPMKDQR